MINFYDIEDAVNYLVAHGVKEFEVDDIKISVTVPPRVMVALGNPAQITVRKEGSMYHAYATVNRVEYVACIGFESDYQNFKQIYGEFKEEGLENEASD